MGKPVLSWKGTASSIWFTPENQMVKPQGINNKSADILDMLLKMTEKREVKKKEKNL
jgi:hypothetical protein